jgi:hypothetical protein
MQRMKPPTKTIIPIKYRNKITYPVQTWGLRRLRERGDEEGACWWWLRTRIWGERRWRWEAKRGLRRRRGNGRSDGRGCQRRVSLFLVPEECAWAGVWISQLGRNYLLGAARENQINFVVPPPYFYDNWWSIVQISIVEKESKMLGYKKCQHRMSVQKGVMVHSFSVNFLCVNPLLYP